MRILTEYLESRPILKPAAEDIVFRYRFCPRPAANSVLYMMYYWSFSRFSPSWWTPLSLHYIPVSRAWVGSTRWAHRLPQINHRLSLAELFHNYLTRYSLTPPHNGAQCNHCLNIPSFSMYSVSHTSVTVPTAQSTDSRRKRLCPSSFLLFLQVVGKLRNCVLPPPAGMECRLKCRSKNKKTGLFKNINHTPLQYLEWR